MKNPTIFLIAIIVFALSVNAVGQGPPKAVLSDEFSDALCSDDLRARIDNFLLELSNNTQARGYIVGRADGSIPGRFQKYFRVFQTHMRFRKFDEKRVSFHRGPDGSTARFELWVIPEGSNIPDVLTPFKPSLITKTTLFDSSAIASIKKGEVEFGEGSWSSEPCDFGLVLNHFAATVNEDNNLLAYLVASSKSRRDAARTNTVLRLTARMLSKTHGIPANRVRTINAGRRVRSEMQLWLVPKGSHPPKFRKDAFK